MTLLQALILGIVQGVAEFLPISSSGHLIIFQNLFGLKEAQLSFDVFLHFMSLTAIIIFFWQKIIKLKTKDFLYIAVGTVPAVIVGLFLKNYADTLFNSTKIVGGTLMLTGLLNLTTDKILQEETDGQLTWQKSFKIGLFQALAIIPGLSRSGFTLAGGALNKLDRKKAFEFSFFLAIPAILGAALLQIIDLYQTGVGQISPLNFIFGGVAAFIAGLFSLKIFNYVIKNTKLELFGWYCLVVGLLTLIFI